MSDAQDARFRAFLQATEEDERNWIAFLEFEQAARRVADRAAIVNPFDDPASNVRETRLLHTPVAEMLFRALKRLSLGPLLANAEGIGHAIRFGLIEAKPEGLDGVADDDALEALADRGDDALKAHMDELHDEQRNESRRMRKRRK